MKPVTTNSQPAYDHAPTQLPQRAHGIPVGPTADDELDEDRREPDERDERQIGDQKRRSAVLAGDEGEPPDVPQSDCAADRGEDEPRPRCPCLACHFVCRIETPDP